MPQHAGIFPGVPASSPAAPQLPKQRAGASPTDDPPVPSEGQYSGFWERWGGGKVLCCGGSTTSREQPRPGQQCYSSASGGGVRCSWKFSFWKTLLVAGSPWETLSSPCLSPPPCAPRASSVSRASCKENPPITFPQGTESSGRHCVPATAEKPEPRYSQGHGWHGGTLQSTVQVTSPQLNSSPGVFKLL